MAGIAAGAADGYAGATPQANLVSLDVMDDSGVARTSDVIAACQWILANKDRVQHPRRELLAALGDARATSSTTRSTRRSRSSGSAASSSSRLPATTAPANTPSGVPFAPGNDPFVITVGAADLGGTLDRNDDTAAPWSAYGRTLDGFVKPDLVAPGRYMVGPVPGNSTLATERADKLVAPGYIQLSGTSFAAPVVAGAAAQILAKHPTYTPDQVKGALMDAGDAAPGCAPGLGRRRRGPGEQGLARQPTRRTRTRAWTRSSSRSPAPASPAFDAVSWIDVAKANVSWDAVSWDDVSWDDAAWNVVSWADVSWADVSWADVSWADVSWADVSWATPRTRTRPRATPAPSRAPTS